MAQDWANPTVCDHIRRYPVIPRDGIISEVYHARKWRQDVDPHTLSPMYDNGSCHFYIDELSRMKNGTLIIPVRWLEDEDRIVHADAYVVKCDHEVQYIRLVLIFHSRLIMLQGIATAVDNETILIRASDLRNNYLQLKDMDLLPVWSCMFRISSEIDV